MSELVEKLITVREGRICSDDATFLRQCVKEVQEFVNIIKEVVMLSITNSRIDFQKHEESLYLTLFSFPKVVTRTMTSTMLQCVPCLLIPVLSHLQTHQPHFKREQIVIVHLVVL